MPLPCPPRITATLAEHSFQHLSDLTFPQHTCSSRREPWDPQRATPMPACTLTQAGCPLSHSAWSWQWLQFLPRKLSSPNSQFMVRSCSPLNRACNSAPPCMPPWTWPCRGPCWVLLQCPALPTSPCHLVTAGFSHQTNGLQTFLTRQFFKTPEKNSGYVAPILMFYLF